MVFDILSIQHLRAWTERRRAAADERELTSALGLSRSTGCRAGNGRPSDDPNLLITNHWYGPLMQYYVIFGGDLRPSPAERASRRKLADFSSE
jgi:hypothetical protein